MRSSDSSERFAQDGHATLDLAEREAAVAEQEARSTWLTDPKVVERRDDHSTLASSSDDCPGVQWRSEFEKNVEPSLQPVDGH